MSSAAIWLIFHLYEPGFPSDPPNPITSTGDLYHHYPMWLTWDTWTVLPHDSLQFIFFLPHILLNVFYTVSQICIPAFRQFLRKVLGGPKRREQKLVWWNNRTSQTRDRTIQTDWLPVWPWQEVRPIRKQRTVRRVGSSSITYYYTKQNGVKKVHIGGEPYSIPRTYLTQLWHLVCYDLGGKWLSA